MMTLRPFGKTGIRISAVGFGTCQLRLIPLGQAMDTLKRGFELGVNWVHAAPDYDGGLEIACEAVRKWGKHVMVASNGYGSMDHFEYLFENTCRFIGRARIELYGIACIDDREYLGENVWGSDGMVAFLQKKKRQGRLQGMFCSTHGPPDYVEKLIQSEVFDAVMISYNPLGFHLLSYFSGGVRPYEDMQGTVRTVFPTAVTCGVSLLIMKALGGGLIPHGKAFLPHHRFSSEPTPVPAGDLLRCILSEPAVTAVVPGTASVSEAEENALSGHEPIDLSKNAREALDRNIRILKGDLCNRCGVCDRTCSRGLPVSWLFRDAYISNYPSETFETEDQLRYFNLHPSPAPPCRGCTQTTCRCPSGLDIPSRLNQVHEQMVKLKTLGKLPPASVGATSGKPPVQIVSFEIPEAAKGGEDIVCRFWIENRGRETWAAEGEGTVSLAVAMHDSVIRRAMLRQPVEPGARTHITFRLSAPSAPGDYPLRFFLTHGSNPGPMPAESLPLLSRVLHVSSGPRHHFQESNRGSHRGQESVS